MPSEETLVDIVKKHPQAQDSDEEIEGQQECTISPTPTATSIESAFSSLGIGGGIMSRNSSDDDPDPHSVSDEDARTYYAGLVSRPLLVYCMQADKELSTPRPNDCGYEKQLLPVFGC